MKELDARSIKRDEVKDNKYADETGSADRNKTLSQKRAKKVYDVLVAAGINPSRLSYFGGGEDKSVGKSARQFARKVIFKLR